MLEPGSQGLIDARSQLWSNTMPLIWNLTVLEIRYPEMRHRASRDPVNMLGLDQLYVAQTRSRFMSRFRPRGTGLLYRTGGAFIGTDFSHCNARVQ